jgi:hypothetical protein
MNTAMMASVHFSNEVSCDVILIIQEQNSPDEWQIIPIPCQLRRVLVSLNLSAESAKAR